MLKGKKVAIIFASSAYAQDNKVVIGKNGDIPWRGRVPSDIKRFKSITVGNSVIMGRKTWDSISPKFRPLSDRQNIILTHKKDFRVDHPNVVVAHSIEEAVQQAKSDPVWIIGGEEIYRLALPFADTIHQTIIYERFEGDIFFPTVNIDDWKSVHFEHFDPGKGEAEKDELRSSYLVFKRFRY